MCATPTLTSRTCGRAHVRRFAAGDPEAARPGSKGGSTTKKEDEEEWVDPPHIAEAKQRLRTFEKEDLYAVLGVAPDVDSDGIITAYNERGAALASAPDFSTNAELKAQLLRLKHATEVCPPTATTTHHDHHPPRSSHVTSCADVVPPPRTRCC